MGYLHINNLYKDQRILMFRECYALEKIHGTSANVAWRENAVWLHSGGEKAERFAALFDKDLLAARFAEIGHTLVHVYGEAYGGSQQGQSYRYGKVLKFVAFDVQVGDSWLAVEQAADFVAKLGLEFVHWAKVSTDLVILDAERDAPSVQAQRNGVEGTHHREGVVLRPLLEFTMNNGERLIVKHKRDEERETKTPRPVVDPAQQAVLTAADAIAEEWVTPTRLQHVLDKMPQGLGLEATGDVIRAMTEDVLREAAGEVVNSKEARRAIGKQAALLFKKHVTTVR